MFCTSTITVSKSLPAGLPWITVTSAVAFGKSGLMLAGASVNCTITVGSAEDSTLTVGASCCPKEGVRSASGVVGKAGPPPVFVPGVLLLVVGVLDPLQALTSNP